MEASIAALTASRVNQDFQPFPPRTRVPTRRLGLATCYPGKISRPRNPTQKTRGAEPDRRVVEHGSTHGWLMNGRPRLSD